MPISPCKIVYQLGGGGQIPLIDLMEGMAWIRQCR